MAIWVLTCFCDHVFVGNKSFDKERYLLDFVPQPDFDEFNLSNEHQKTYVLDKDASPKPVYITSNLVIIHIQFLNF